MPYLLGAYAALPPTVRNGPDGDIFHANIAQTAQLGGFEVPFWATWTAADVQRSASYLRPHHRAVVTMLPGTVAQLAGDRRFGLASTDPDARAAALAHLATAHESIRKLHDALGRAAISAILVPSAPGGSPSAASGTRLAESLMTAATWDWDGARVVVEHCDARVDWHQPAKGFLTLTEEVDAVVHANDQTHARMGICINWGRSVLETRRTASAAEHIIKASNAGLLAGVVFSGCSPQDTVYGAAWADAHLPPASEPDLDCGGAHSLLTRAEMTRCLREISDRQSVFVGLKIATPAQARLETRIDIVGNSLKMLGEADTPTSAGGLQEPPQ